MNRQIKIAPIAEDAEEVAQDLRRTVVAVERIVDDLKIIWIIVSPLIEWLKSTPAGRPVNVELVVSREEVP